MTVSIFRIHSIALVKYLREVKYQRGSQVFIRPSGAVQSSVACTMIWSYHNRWDWDCTLIQGALYRARGGRSVVQGMVMLVSIFV